MGLFGDDEDETLSDQALIAAIRKRLMDEISGGGRGQDTERIINNVYGSMPQGGGLVDRLYQGQMDQPQDGGQGEDPYEYFVDIDRTNKYDPDDPTRSIGWEKQVRRYRDKKKA